MNRFRKTKDCPSSEKILAFQLGEVGPATGIEIRSHFQDCEFCAAEVEFYALYPPMDENGRLEKIPPPLYELADALLRRTRDLRALYRLIAPE